jgi:beta-lactamase regulating signal transducer with metallopeptidase domain
MIFVARGFLVSFAFFATVYCPLSCLVVLAWRSMKHIGRESRANSANFLFALRIFPFAVSGVIAVFFTFPSFWLMERASLDEDAATFVLAACSLVILVAGVLRVLRAQAQTTRAVNRWSSDATNRDSAKTTLSASRGAPALILVGIRKPKVMVSDVAAMVLSDGELQAAIRHELVHKRSWDNLKKVLISATPFPGMISIESAWRESSELAADDAAVANRQDALDLAAALIKLSRSSKQWSEPALASGLVSGESSIGLRVQRLLDWRKCRPRREHRVALACFLLAMIVGVASNYSASLALTHRLTEILVP